MKKTFLFLFNFSFDDVLLDRIELKPYINKKKRFFLLEIRETKKKTAICIFEKKNKKYKFIYGFDLDFLGKEVYFSGYVDRKTKKFTKDYFYYYNPKKINYAGNFVILIGGEYSKKELESKFKKKEYSHMKRKNTFFAKKSILFYIPENNRKKAFFTSMRSHANPMQFFEEPREKKRIISMIKSNYSFIYFFTYSLNGAESNRIGLSTEQKSFRDKYYFDMKDLKAKGIAEPTPMWDSKVKPYKNVFGEELLD